MTDRESTSFAAGRTASGGRVINGRLRRRVLKVGLLWTALWWSIVGLLIGPVLPGFGLPVLAAALLAVSPLLLLGRGVYPSARLRLLVLRPFWYVQLGVPIAALGGAAGVLGGALVGEPVAGGRRMLLLAAAAFVLLAAAGFVGSRRLRVRRLAARIADLPPALEGMRIVQVSDLHVGPHTSRRHLTRVRAAIDAARPELIAITGDQVDDHAADVEHFAAAFGGLSAPLGVFAVPGNHDVYAGWGGVRAGLEAIGLTVLVNQAVEITRAGERFFVAGTGDPAGRMWPGGGAAPDIARTLDRVPAGAFVLVLAHNPALWPQLAGRGVPLTLSGHTHHGQFSIPHLGWSLASVFLEHAMGAHRRGASLLYINPGTNYWGLPLRIGALPEVTVLTLRDAGPGEAAIAEEEAAPASLLNSFQSSPTES